MSVTFDLIEEPFIPVLRKDGAYVEYGLRETLLRAGEINELRDSSPLVTVALHRLLLLVLHRVYDGPKNREARVKILKAGVFDAEKIEAYFAKWKHRFDLFHETHPFFQRAGFKTKEPSPINRLAQERSRGNNAALFDHTVDDPPLSFTPAQAARSVIAEQAFAVGGGKSDTGNSTHAPLVSGAVVLAQGDSLFETLWLNLTEYDGDQRPVACDDDQPFWERDPEAPHEQSGVPSGYLDYLGWPARTLCLLPVEEDGAVVVRRVCYAQGRKFDPSGLFFDPMIGYFRPDKKDEPYRTVRFNEFRDLWRDSAALFQFGDTDRCKGPTALETLKGFDDAVLPRRSWYRVSLIGLCTDKAKVLFWRHEMLPLPLEYLDDPQAVVHLQKALNVAEEVSKIALRPAAWAVASNRLTASAESCPDKGRVSQLVDSLAPERHYWSRLELPFREFMVRLAEVAEESRNTVVDEWYWETVRKVALQAFERCVEVIDTGRDLKAINAGRGVLYSRLKQIQSENHISAREKQKAGAS